MSVSIWDLIKYLYKWKIAIIIVTIVSFLLADVYVSKNQTYSAKIIIQYNDGCISNGKTLDGEMFDSNEIKSPTVILNVLKDLGYENKKIEAIREHISISPITPKTVENLKSAKEKLGEEYQFYPNTFAVTYSGNSSFEVTRDTLSSVILNYFNYYSEKYLYLATLNEIDYNLNKKNFDYIEQAEQINDNLKQTIDLLTNYAHDSADFRSSNTGMTFSDLTKEFELIKNHSMPRIFSEIYAGQVSLNEPLLIDKYTDRYENNLLEMENLQTRADITFDRMEAYAKSDKQDSKSNNEDGSSDNVSIIPNIEHDDNGTVEEQTTYDNLITNYTNDSIAANNRKIDAEYCQNIIEIFKAEKNPDINYEEYETDVKKSIADVLSKLESLYQKANINISDYNAYIPALHIKKLSGVSYYGNMNGSVYKLIAIIIGFALSCLAAIAYEIMRKYSLYSVEESKAAETESENSEE